IDLARQRDAKLLAQERVRETEVGVLEAGLQEADVLHQAIAQVVEVAADVELPAVLVAPAHDGPVAQRGLAEVRGGAVEDGRSGRAVEVERPGQEAGQEGLFGALGGVAVGAGVVVPNIDVEAVPHGVVVAGVANGVGVGVEAGEVEEESGKLDVVLVKAKRPELDPGVLGEAIANGEVPAFGVVTGGHVASVAGLVVIADAQVVASAEAPVGVAALEDLQGGLALAVGLVAVGGAALSREAVLVARGVGGDDVNEGKARSGGVGIGPLEEGDAADVARVELADGGIDVLASGEEEPAVAVGDELADTVAADARVGDDRVALLDLDTGGFRGTQQQAG